jgi:hypothetical protein
MTDGHVGPFNPVSGAKDAPDPLGYIGKRSEHPFKHANDPPKGG